MILDSL